MISVRRSQEYQRIASLPRRRVSYEDAVDWARELTPMFVAPGSTERLQPWQGYALAEFVANQGAVLWYPVGVGKTLIAELAPIAIGAQRPILVIPTSAKGKTYADRVAYMRRGWLLRSPPIHIVTLHDLMSPNGGDILLDRLRPDCIVIDECDGLANPESSMAKRLLRYVAPLTRSECAVVAMTGTPIRKSILGIAHIMYMALREGTPLPLTDELEIWAGAIDLGVTGMRPDPGPLGPTAKLARQWVSRRIAETPGVVIVDGDSCQQPLHVRTIPARECAKLNQVFDDFRMKDETPGGEVVSDGLSRWRLAGQLGCGLYTYFDPPPPERWRAAYRAKGAFVREQIRQSADTARPLDTEAKVLRRYPSHPVVEEWRAVKPTFRPRTSVEWISDATIWSVRDWLDSEQSPGIVWSGCVPFGERCARMLGLQYYGERGRTASGMALHAAPVGRHLVASWKANMRGFNLQNWRRQLLVDPPASAKYLEQIFGRSHRQGQDQPVKVYILCTSGDTYDYVMAAIGEASFGRDLARMTPKLLRASITHQRPAITPANEMRWASASNNTRKKDRI